MPNNRTSRRAGVWIGSPVMKEPPPAWPMRERTHAAQRGTNAGIRSTCSPSIAEHGQRVGRMPTSSSPATRSCSCAVRLALFHLMASVADEGEAAVGARGLIGRATAAMCSGTAMCMSFRSWPHRIHPPRGPCSSTACSGFRAALAAARREGRAGARFAWESAASGEDMTPVRYQTCTAASDLIYTGQREEHIVADVAWAAAHYIDWTGDDAFAAGPGLELLVQTARWWASRIELDSDGSGHIRGVIGPDEYHELVDDDAYTNVMARWNLRRAAGADQSGATRRRASPTTGSSSRTPSSMAMTLQRGSTSSSPASSNSSRF